jgi:hypothetical protein
MRITQCCGEMLGCCTKLLKELICYRLICYTAISCRFGSAAAAVLQQQQCMMFVLQTRPSALGCAAAAAGIQLGSTTLVPNVLVHTSYPLLLLLLLLQAFSWAPPPWCPTC